MRRVAVALALVGSLLWIGAPSSAEVVSVRDPRPKCSQAPALDVKRTTFDYGQERFVWRVKMAQLSRKKTRVFARYTLGNRRADRFGVILTTRFDARGQKRVVGHWSDYETEEYGVRFTDGLSARWDWKRDVITFRLTSHLRGRAADAWAYSIAKGALHGPECGDYIWSGRIRRG